MVHLVADGRLESGQPLGPQRITQTVRAERARRDSHQAEREPEDEERSMHAGKVERARFRRLPRILGWVGLAEHKGRRDVRDPSVGRKDDGEEG